MSERRRSGRATRDQIVAAVEQFHATTNSWPTRHQVAAAVDRTPDGIRHHIDELVKSGYLIREGGTIKLLDLEPVPLDVLLPTPTETLDHLIMATIAWAHKHGQPSVRVGNVIAHIIAERSSDIEARMEALVEQGRLVKTEAGYELPDTE